MDENIMKDLGMVTAYAYAVSKGYTGTEDEFAELMASYASTAQTAVDAALRAKASEDAAKASETASAASETAASTSASSASTSATNAAQDAQRAENAKNAAAAQASTAANQAIAATQSANTASAKATEASQSASSASESATTAQTAKTAAETAQAAAETAETNAKASETAAANSATSASNSATTATTKASEAAQSATDAGTSATNAAASATSASGSASTASTKASESAQSATNAANSATAAGTAKTDAEAAKTAAQTAQTAAETAQGKAEDAQAAAEAAAQTLVIDSTLTQPNQAAEAKATGDAISLVKSHLNAVEIVDTASGAIATFADGSDGVPVESLTVDIEPIQNLHGMPYPYPAGTTLNLIPDGTNTENGYVADTHLNADGTTTADGNAYTSEYFPVTEEETYTWSCTTGANVSSLCFYDANKTYISGVQASNELPKTMIAPVGAAYARSTQLKSTSGNCFQFELGSTATTPMFYSNICPIEGYTNVSVFRRGINLFDGEMENGDISEATGNNSGTSTSRQRSKNYIPINSAIGTVYFYTPGHSGNFRAYYYDASKRYLMYTAVSANHVFTLPSSIADRVEYIRFRFSSVALDGDAYISINYPSTETGYIPYQGQTVTIPLGDTIYGGSLDVTNGVLTVDRSFKTFDGSENWTLSPTSSDTVKNYVFQAYGRDEIYGTSGHKPISNQFIGIGETTILVPDGRFCYMSYGRYLKVGTTIPTVEEWKAYLAEHSLQTCAYLQTPLTIQLTPQQISTLLGQNNIWSDGGDVSVDYVADTKLYIEQLTEPDADMIADANITSGKYFMVGNSLFLATANIASGGTISPGVNCTRTSLAAALNAINA